MAKNRIVYVIFLAVTIVFLALYENQLTYTVFYAAILFPLLSLLFMILSKRSFDVFDQLSAETVQKEERLTYYFTVKNPGFFFYTNVKAVFKDISSSILLDTKYVNLSLPPYGSSDASIEIYTKYRGVNTIGVSELYIYDFLGLFYLKQKLKKTLILTVLPKVTDISNFMAPVANKSESAQKTGKLEEDYSEIEDFKKHLPPDSIRKINWKMSARKNELISKIYKTSANSLSYIVFDNTSITYTGKDKDLLIASREDQMLEALVSVLAFLTEKQFMISFHYIGDNGDPEQIVSSEFAAFYAKASVLQFNHNLKFDIFMNHVINNSSKDAIDSIMIFTQSITPDFINTVHQIISDGHQAVVLFFGTENDNNSKKQLELLHEKGDFYKYTPDFSSFTDNISA